MFATWKHARNETCVEVYSHCWGHFARQISRILCFKLFCARSGKITKSKGFSGGKIYLNENNMKCKTSVGILVQRNFFSRDSHKTCLWPSLESFVAGFRGHLTPKINITFLSQIRCWILFYSKISLNRAVFSEKIVKNCFGGTFDHFLGKGGVLYKKWT